MPHNIFVGKIYASRNSLWGSSFFRSDWRGKSNLTSNYFLRPLWGDGVYLLFPITKVSKLLFNLFGNKRRHTCWFCGCCQLWLHNSFWRGFDRRSGSGRDYAGNFSGWGGNNIHSPCSGWRGGKLAGRTFCRDGFLAGNFL